MKGNSDTSNPRRLDSRR